MSDPAIALSDLALGIAGRRVLAVPRLEVQAGEVVGLLGPNGAGKTTLLHVCVGLRRGWSGQVRVLGEDVAALRGEGLSRLRQRAALLPQLPPALGQLPLTVREVVAVGRSGRRGLLRPLRRGDWQAVDLWLDRLGLAELGGAGFAEVSGGEQRRALLARAMVQEAELLLLDEPTAFLDLGGREQVVAALDELQRRWGRTIVVVCHEVEVLPRCCRRVVLLDQGSVLDDGAPEAVLSAPAIRRLYGWPRARVVHEDGRHAVLPLAE